jgi:hypothetical protein
MKRCKLFKNKKNNLENIGAINFLFKKRKILFDKLPPLG